MINDAEQGIILIVDDNPTNLEVLYGALTEAGYEVLVEMDGKSGIEQAKYTVIDLILLDVMMPGIDGFETCRLLKEEILTQEIPIIFMTALSDVVDKVKGLSLGAVDYITKPFQKEEVLARIKTHIKLHRLKLELWQEKQLLEHRVQQRTEKLSQALEELQKAQYQLVNSEKMSALGQLVAGFAHEINNPLSFLSGNLEQATQATNDMIDYLCLCQEKCHPTDQEVSRKGEEIELEYLMEDLPQMLSSMRVGIERIANLSKALRTFARGDSEDKCLANVHDGLDSTLMILQHRLKANNTRPEIQVIKNYDGRLPEISCYLGKLNQVFMNILSNAIDALEEMNKERSFGEIKFHPNQIIITTDFDARKKIIVIKIKDNAGGIPEPIKSKVFDELFTTKSVGKGTGLGLSISRKIVEENHGGTLTFESFLGEGTEFTICLPQYLSSN
ncbi:MAG: hybrid sensor histidine kinase/response regulator [Microcoleaceae cyanobacterium]